MQVKEFIFVLKEPIRRQCICEWKLVGNHKGGYSAFTFDVTDYVHTGRNLVAVSVDNSYNPDIAPLSADFTFFGGLYRMFIWCILRPCNCLPLIMLPVEYISKLLG